MSPGRALLPLVLVGGLLSACGGGEAAPTATVTVTVTVTEPAADAPSASASATQGANGVSAPIPGACTLLSQAEANAVADVELQAGVPSNGLCQWTSDPYGGTTAQVEVITGDGAQKALEIDRDVLTHPFTDVAGIGDEAHQEDNQIFVRKGKNWFTIRLVRLEDPAGFVQPIQTAAKLVVDRLP